MKTIRKYQYIFLISIIALGASALGANISVSVIPDKQSVSKSESVLWTVLVSNPSDVTLTNAKLRINLPTKIDDVYWEEFNYQPSTYINNPFGLYLAGQVVEFDVGTMPPGHSLPVRVTTWPSGVSTAGTLLEMSAQAECDQAFATGQATSKVGTRTSRIQLSAPSMHAESNKSYNFSANYSYTDSLPLEGAKLVVTMPAGFSASSGTHGFTYSFPKISWNFGTLLKGDNGYRSFTLKSNSIARAGTILMLKAEIIHNGVVIDRANWPIIVSSQAGLSCKSNSTQWQTDSDGSILWNIEVQNQSQLPSTGTKLYVNLPSNLEPLYYSYLNPIPATNSNIFGEYQPGQRVVYYIGSMNPGAKKIFQIRAWPDSSAPKGGQFLLSANTDSANGVHGTTSQWAVTLGSYFPMKSDIQIEHPEFTQHVDGQTAPVSFGSRMVSRSASKRFYIRNLGAIDLSISTVKIVGLNANDWSVGELGNAQILSRAKTSFPITFRPKAKGLRKAILRVYSNDPNESPYDIKLVGTGL